MSITFNSIDLTGSGSMVNFPSGYPSAMDVPVSVLDSPSREGGIVVKGKFNSPSFTGSYQILSGGMAECSVIKALVGTISTLTIESYTISSVLLQAVSLPSQLGNGALQCQLQFKKVKE